MNIKLVALLDVDLSHVIGGMFAPFVNTWQSDAPPLPKAPASDTTLARDMVGGAIACGLAAKAAGAPPPLVATSATGGALLAGIDHTFKAIEIPPAPPLNLATYSFSAMNGRDFRQSM